jgi:Uma2 family endonuclease
VSTVTHSVVHPRLREDEYVAMQQQAGWSLPVEFVDGEAVLLPPDGFDASSAQGELYFALRRWQERPFGSGGTLVQNVFVQLPAGGRLAPDIAWWVRRLEPGEVLGAVRGRVPNLVVEVLCPATRENDLGFKRDLYVQAEVQELWLVDPAARTVTRVRPRKPDETLAAGESLTSPLLDGFSVAVAGLFGAQST